MNGAAPIGDLMAAAGKQWHVEHSDLGLWTAEKRSADGRHLRFLVARTAAELAAKIRGAEEE